MFKKHLEKLVPNRGYLGDSLGIQHSAKKLLDLFNTKIYRIVIILWSERKNLTELVGSLLIITAIGILWLIPGHFVQSASALESVKASGRGSIICPDGRIFNNAQIQFESAENKKGNVSSGNWDIELSGTAPAPNKTGSIYRAEITKSHDFILTGTEQQDI